MFDGNKFDVTASVQQHRLPLEEMGNVLLDAMQGTLICLDNHHIIIDVSKSIKQYFGFEQAEIIGLSILLLVEDSERDLFSKFLSSTSQLFDVCCVRMMMAISNDYRQVKVHRKKKVNQDNADVHSTTTRHNGSVGTILVLTLDDSSYIDVTLFDANKAEFYTKLNLLGEIIFTDHRGALITGYLPHELLSQSIFSLVYHEDRLVHLHALWKCVTEGFSRLQWRLNTRDGSLVYLLTHYKLIRNHQNQDTIVARNEVLNLSQQEKFDELQKSSRYQCATDIRANTSSFKLITSTDTDPSSIPPGECCICVPSLNMCFSTKKLQTLNVAGNIFEASRPVRPLTIQDYVSILTDNDKNIDSELVNMITNLSSLSSRYRHLNQQSSTETDTLDVPMNGKSQLGSSDSSSRKKKDDDSIVRGLLNNSIKYNHEKQTGDSESASMELSNGNSGHNDPPIPPQQSQTKAKTEPLDPETIRKRHADFMIKYRTAKAKLESQLGSSRSQEIANGRQTNDIVKQNTILNKLSQLENIKNKHLTRMFELKRQIQHRTPSTLVADLEQASLLSSPKLSELMPMDNPNPTNVQSSIYSPPTYYQHQRDSPPVYRPLDPQSSYHDPYASITTPIFDEFLTPPSSTSYHPVNNPPLSAHSYMNVLFQETTGTIPTTMTSSPFNDHSTTYPH